ncbi:FAD-binding dehydrogenase [Nocardioides marmotae]|uniref:FAD-binding dehydrogenase n=1 Tax=Nocardioides marmotae TaxID=2663857 RepID=UPI0012B570D4|nr:FAD-binding dehydrogenase [Nocardioides marmotae]MBC9734297.1 FAD-binding dehydrogenase [Nocardioides marmotae]MTB85398.1 FAD-binding dehydrogenase [Nocardioides marmotae]
MDGWSADLVVVGAGLAGLVAAAEAADAGRSVLLLDQEGEQSLGGQAFWSLGGLFLVDSPEQRRMGVKDSLELARQDWFGSAQFDRPEDRWPRAWAEAYLQFAAGEKRAWLRQMGHRVFPVVGWAERGDGTASGHGNSVPRFHITWGTGPGVVAPFERRVREHVATGRIRLGFRHRVDELLVEGGAAVGVRGALLEPTSVDRGRPSSRTVVGDFEARGAAVVVTSGGIGGDHDLVRRNWPARLGTPPKRMVAGVPAHVDGRMLRITQDAGANVVNPDRMWHYVEGLRNWDPIWADHGIRILPGPSSLWLDAEGNRLPAPYFPGFDTLGTLRHLRATGHDYSWFVLTQRIIEKEFALSGSEQNPDLTGKDLKLLLSRVKKGAAGPVEAFKQHGEDFVVAETLEELVAGMNRVADDDVPPLEAARVRTIVEARDREMDNTYSKDAQVTAIHGARTFLGDKLIRVARPHKLLDPAAGPLIAVRLNILSRKTLGGLETDLDGRCLRADGSAFPGLYAAGEVSGFGGGGMMGYNALEGTFLGGCLFSGRVAGRAAARAV